MFPLAWISGQWMESCAALGWLHARCLPSTAHQLRIGLQGSAPPLWRRIQIPSAASLGFLHDVIQMAFGWDGYHLHRFQDGRGREWGEPPVGDGGGHMAAAFADQEEASLGKVLRAEGGVLECVCDLGDSWLHRIEAEKIMPLGPGVAYPRCTGGRRAAPPAEDIGGIWGLEEVVYLVTRPEADPPGHFEDLVAQLREKGYDPGAFDPAELTVMLSGLTVRTAAKATRTRNGKTLSDFGAADAEWGTTKWRGDRSNGGCDTGHRQGTGEATAPFRAQGTHPQVTDPDSQLVDADRDQAVRGERARVRGIHGGRPRRPGLPRVHRWRRRELPGGTGARDVRSRLSRGAG